MKKNTLAENMRRFGTKNLRESIDAQAIIDRAVEEHESYGKKCITQKNCPNLIRFAAGEALTIYGIIFSFFPATEYAMMSPAFMSLQWEPKTLPITKWVWGKAYKALSAIEKEKILSEVERVVKCLGQDYFERVINPFGF